ncbi:MAG: ATP-binding cassette domain-containing protein, partial [Acidobacteria bacterium]|nr:ATP-binding cassette domain-containing protein [Acidobacteriota bacterium]
AVATAAATAGLDVDVAGFGKGFDTMVGERGITLSGGQKQRAAIARALCVDPRILIFDDALSAVDTTTEDLILRRLREVRQTRTCLIVAHRMSTVRDADLILVLDAGRVIERGTHDSLVARGGVYAAMDRRQRLEQELAAS